MLEADLIAERRKWVATFVYVDQIFTIIGCFYLFFSTLISSMSYHFSFLWIDSIAEIMAATVQIATYYHLSFYAYDQRVLRIQQWVMAFNLIQLGFLLKDTIVLQEQMRTSPVIIPPFLQYSILFPLLLLLCFCNLLLLTVLAVVHLS
jgi:hypothetical protein